MSKKLRVAVYCRVSTAQDSQTLSFEMQKDYYEKYVNANPEWELKEIYADKGVSGTILNSRREQFNKMLLACGIEVIQTKSEFSVRETNKPSDYDMIICKDEKRFARNMDINSIVTHLKNKGVGVFFETRSINTLDKNDVTLKLLFALSEDYSKSLSKNLKISYERAHLKNPMILGKSAPFGYRFGRNEKGERTLEPISDDYVKIINDIFDMYINGDGFRVIAKYVNEQGFKTENGKPIEKYTIERIIKNEKFMGYIQVIRHTPDSINNYGHTLRKKMNYDIIKSDKIIPMVSEEKWKQANEKLKHKPISEKSRGINYQKSKYSRKILCYNCLHYYIKTKATNGEDIYVCSSKRERLGSADTCKSPYISESFLDDYLDTLLKDNNFIKEEKKKIESIINYFINHRYALIATFFKERDIQLINSLKQQIKEIEDKQDFIFNQFTEIPRDVLNRKVNSLEDEKKVLQAKLNKEEFSFEQFKNELEIIDNAVKEFRNYKIESVKTHSDLLNFIEIEVKPNNPDSPIRQKRDDCTLKYRSIFQGDYEGNQFAVLGKLKLKVNEEISKRMTTDNFNLKDNPFSREEMDELDKKLKGIL